MTLLARIFNHPVLRENPPILVDVGASGGIHPAWQRIARYSIGVGFEPDSRETSGLAIAQCSFRRWVLVPQLVVAERGLTEADFQLTASPFCSSLLRPNTPALADWAFADCFETRESRRLPATTLVETLESEGLTHIDWLKCDTQGTDLSIFYSLPVSMRRRLMAVEFEPGLIDAYHGEEKLHHVLGAMEQEPFWLARLEVKGTPRGRPAMLQSRLGHTWARRYRHLGPSAPGWAETTFLHRLHADDSELDTRQLLILWVIAMENRHPAFACEVAEVGTRRCGDPLFAQLETAATRAMRKSIAQTWPRWPALLWRNLLRRFIAQCR